MWTRVLVLSVVFVLASVAEPAPRMDVVVVNLPQLSARDISASMAVAARLFAGTAIPLRFTVQSTPCRSLAGPLPRRLVILLDQPALDRFPFRDSTLGVALTDRAYVLVPRIRQLAAVKDVPVSAILGVVIAHELGHLLLGPGHSSTGVMRPVCGHPEFGLALRGQPGFNRHQARQMRARLSALLTSPAR